MKRLMMWMMLACLVLTACACDRQYDPRSYGFPVKPVGEVPPEFEEIVAENRFGNARWVGDKLVEVDSHLKWLDMYGNVIAAYEIPTGGYRSVKNDALLSTSDGGMLIALGFEERYVSENKAWASEGGFSSMVIKLDASANVQWMTELDGVEGMMLRNCFETEDGYCFLGEQQTPETKRLGVYSRTDLSVLVLDKQGQLTTVKTFGGSDYDEFWRAEKVADGFAIYALSQSNDGLFENSLPEGEHSECWRITLDERFDVAGMERVEFELLKQNLYSAGEPLTLDYGDFKLIVSENITGVYKNQPVLISSIWYTYETVYSAYEDGKLLWRAAVNSSPDYDAMVEELRQRAE